MAVTRATLQQLAVPLNRRDFAAFVEEVERLPAPERKILAVLGAVELLVNGDGARDYLRDPAALTAEQAGFRLEHVDET